MRNFQIVYVTAVMTLFGLSQQASADVLYSQPWNGTGNIQASENDTSAGGYGNFATMYDNFTLGGGGTITEVDWTGGYFNPSTQGPITSFTITIYSDNSGQPGASVYSTTIPGAAGETYVGTYFNNPIYDYSASMNFTATTGVQYWLSIVANEPSTFPQWAWSEGTGGDGSSYQLYEGDLSTFGSDLAFTLDSTPLPSALWLFASGIGSVGLLARKAKRKSAAAA